jgi:hypothetical protein
MRIENDRQLQNALRELEGLDLVGAEKAPAEDADLWGPDFADLADTEDRDVANPQDYDSRRRELKQAISAYLEGRRFPGPRRQVSS